jgi:transposase
VRSLFLAYFTTGRGNNGGTETINGIIELHRRIARGFRNPACWGRWGCAAR